eukprot:PhF_6_TR31401/c0_g1_i3/m.46012
MSQTNRRMLIVGIVAFLAGGLLTITVLPFFLTSEAHSNEYVTTVSSTAGSSGIRETQLSIPPPPPPPPPKLSNSDDDVAPPKIQLKYEDIEANAQARANSKIQATACQTKCDRIGSSYKKKGKPSRFLSEPTGVVPERVVNALRACNAKKEELSAMKRGTSIPGIYVDLGCRWYITSVGKFQSEYYRGAEYVAHAVDADP